MSQAEVEGLRARDAARWFREHADASEGAARDPFEPVAGWRGYHRIRKRDDGACGFLSLEGRCRLHEELGANRKPLACRLFPYSFHPAPSATIVKTSFGCPTVVANQGESIAGAVRLGEIEALRDEWLAGHRSVTAPRVFVPGRSLSSDSLRILRENLRRMLDRTETDGTRDLRANVRRMALALEDLTRRRVVGLPDADFVEYVGLTIPFAAVSIQAVARRPPTRVGRLLQHGFLFVVAAMRWRLENRHASRLLLRWQMLRLLAHFHHLAPAFGRVDVAALGRDRVDVNAPEMQPVVYHYLRSSLASLGAGERPVLDDLAIAVSYLNAASALAVMNAHASGEGVTRAIFRAALMEAVDLAHIDDRGLLGRFLGRFAGGVEALYEFGR